MPIHTHEFVETYKGLVGYGFDRETDENTVKYYLQKFSDDRFMELMTTRMTEGELLELYDHINRLLCTVILSPHIDNRYFLTANTIGTKADSFFARNPN